MEYKEATEKAKSLANTHLAECIEEVLEWRKTAVLRNGRVREIEAVCETLDNTNPTRMAEDFVISAALGRLAGNPKQESLKEVLHQLPQKHQRQDSLNDQLFDLRFVANRLGMYDAADYIRSILVRD